MTGSHDLPLPRLDEGDVAFDTLAGSVRTPRAPGDLEQLYDVPVTVSAVLGRSRMPIGDLLRIGPGAVLELDREVGEPIDIYVNDRLVARGEVVLVDDRLGVTLTEIVRPAS